MVEVEVVETSELGDRISIAHDGITAVVIDPQWDLDRLEATLTAKGLTCAAVLETHVHNDYVTGGQFRSVRRLAGLLDDAARVFPTHGFGSFCSSGSASGFPTPSCGCIAPAASVPP